MKYNICYDTEEETLLASEGGAGSHAVEGAVEHWQEHYIQIQFIFLYFL